MRQDYRCLVRHEIAQTLSSPWDLEDEMRYLVELITT